MTALPQVDLQAEVLRLLQQIPPGSVTTYGDLARALGDEATRSARWLGEYLTNHPHTDRCPCHRVVRSTGEIGLHISGDSRNKARLLKTEGVSVSNSGHVDLSARFVDFESEKPLARLRIFQKQLAAEVRCIPLPAPPKTVAGVDVAYRKDGTACGVYCLLDARSLEVIDEISLTMAVTFPYIPGYLMYRELPVMLKLCEQARKRGALADVILCDGNGQLHPWRAGIACCLGVLLNHPAIGVGKSLLCGQVDRNSLRPDEPVPVLDQGTTIGNALRTSTSRRPIYISVGHLTTLSEATALAQACLARHRLPEPVFLADLGTKQLKKSS